MKLSIIIPIYNAEKYIEQCLNSVLKQNILTEEYEILLIDDGSTDKSITIAKGYSEKNGNIHLYTQKNQGVSITRNNGIKYAQGKYIYFIDSDDYLALNTLNKLVHFACSNNLDILEFKNIRTKLRNYKKPISKDFIITDLEIMNGQKYISSRAFHDAVWVYFYKREFLIKSKLKFYENRTKQDMIFNAELIPKAERVAFYPLDAYRYIINPNSITTRKDPIGLRRSIEDFIFITIKYSELIIKLESEKIDTSILKLKQQIQLFNIFKGLLMSNFQIAEINQIKKKLSDYKLFPLNTYSGKNKYRKYLILIFNNKFLFFIFIWLYRLLKFPINNTIIENYQNNKEETITSHFV